MKTLNIGLMGFGRIGRNLLRLSLKDESVKIKAIADTADKENLVYLLRYDSIYGKLKQDVSISKDGFKVGNHEINFYKWEHPSDTNWDQESVDYVIQATGKPQSKESCMKHIESGAKKVILASTPLDYNEIPIYVPGVISDKSSLDTEVISLGSNTSIAAGPVLKILDDKFGIENAFISTIHGYSNSNRLSDVAGEGFRINRAAGENIIPMLTQSAKVIQHAIPSLKDKIASSSMNVPVPDGSTLDLTIHFKKNVTVKEIINFLDKETEGSLKGKIAITYDPIVSSDVVGSTYSGIIDSIATIGIGGNKIKLLLWFDNGWGYSSQILDLIKFLSKDTNNE